ncbi:hypothetical protein [Larkinella soli]|uniref:hypothetical protein n=1 Tax=Larkinella soli TaxID=1770527 RepID=UPI000FFC145A|nr:hypothetical protein [Larkinella soli]
MKRIVYSLVLAGIVAMGAFANPVTTDKKEPAASGNWQQQIALHLVRPDVLKKNNPGSVVVISFQINEDNRLARLRVFSEDERLNNDLIRQLTGKRVNAPASELEKTHLMRLHFSTR